MPSLEPLAVRLRGRRSRALISSSSTIRPRAEVDQEQVPGLEAALAQDVLGRLVEDAGLGGEDDPAVLRLHPAAGAQAVAVERRADHGAVGEGDRRRAVPRLGQAAVEGVEARAARRSCPRGRRRPRGSSSSSRAAATGPRARAARARCRSWPCPSRPGGRPAAPCAGRRRRARRRAATRARASS